jgi:hypothetical protein
MGKHELVASGSISVSVIVFEKNAKHDEIATKVSVTTITHVHGESDMRYSIVRELHESLNPTPLFLKRNRQNQFPNFVWMARH